MPIIENNNFRSAFNTVAELMTKPSFLRYEAPGDIGCACTALRAAKDTRALAIQLSGSHVTVCASNGDTVKTVEIDSVGGQASSLQMAYQIIKTVSEVATGVVDIVFNISGMPTQGSNAEDFERKHNFTMSKAPGLYYLPNFKNGPARAAHHIHDVGSPNSQNHYVSISEDLHKLVPNAGIKITDEIGSINNKLGTSGPQLNVEVINDTAMAAMTAASIEKDAEYDVQNVDGIVLGTGNNKGQVRNFAEPNQTVINEESGHAQVDHNFIPRLNLYSRGSLTAERIFAGGNDRETDAKGFRGLRLGLHDFLQTIHRAGDNGTQIQLIKREIEAINLRLPAASQITESSTTVFLDLFKKMGSYFKDGTITIPSNREITQAAKEIGSFEHGLVVEKYKLLAEFYKDRDGAEHYRDLQLLAVTGSTIVDDLVNIPEARKIFCDTLGITEDKLFVHQLGGIDGMEFMTKIRAARIKSGNP